jgi:two-component system, OmpR family, response regulator
MLADAAFRTTSARNCGETGTSGSSSRQPLVLITDEDQSMRNTLVDYLELHSMRAISAPNDKGVERLFADAEPNLVILDLPPRQDDGFDLLRQIRARSDVPLIITSRHQHEEFNRVVCLELGADVYLGTPFGLRELIARIRAVLRRQGDAHRMSHHADKRGRFRFSGWELDRRSRRLQDPSGTTVALTRGEYTLLVAFLDAPRRPLSREYLLRATSIHEDVFDRSIDVRIMRLRRKIETDASAPRIIHSERGVGYVFDLPVEHL